MIVAASSLAACDLDALQSGKTEVDERLARLGSPSLGTWAGAAMLEERVDDRATIAPVVLASLREESG
jgi:hypothetical protein